MANTAKKFNSRAARVAQNLTQGIGVDASDNHYPAANTAAIVNIALDPTAPIDVEQVSYSYSAAPTGGRLLIESPVGTTIHDQDITLAGAGSITFTPPLQGPVAQAVRVTLAAAGGGIIGKLNVRAKILG